MHWQRSFLIVTPSNCAFGSSLLNYIQFVNTLTKYKYKDGTKVPRWQVTVSFSHLIAYKLVLLRSCDIAYCVWFHREPLLLNFEKIALFKKISYSHSEQQSPMSAPFGKSTVANLERIFLKRELNQTQDLYFSTSEFLNLNPVRGTPAKVVVVVALLDVVVVADWVEEEGS